MSLPVVPEPIVDFHLQVLACFIVALFLSLCCLFRPASQPANQPSTICQLHADRSLSHHLFLLFNDLSGPGKLLHDMSRVFFLYYFEILSFTYLDRCWVPSS